MDRLCAEDAGRPIRLGLPPVRRESGSACRDAAAGEGERHRRSAGAATAAAARLMSAMFPGFERFAARDFDVAGIRIHGRVGGSGPPLLLLHGNPLTHVSWHKIASQLAEKFTVVATDLRGYGDSAKPPGGESSVGYSFRTMANDQVEVMRSLGFDKWRVAGHDRGGRVAHRMALDHPQCVEKAAFLDIVPTHHMLNNIKRQWAVDSYHWFFMAQPYDYPEKMIEAYG